MARHAIAKPASFHMASLGKKTVHFVSRYEPAGSHRSSYPKIPKNKVNKSDNQKSSKRKKQKHSKAWKAYSKKIREMSPP
jgi:hypothetical protein